MTRYGEKPVKKPGVRSRASKKKTAEKAQAQDRKAQRRYGVVQFALRWMKRHKDENPSLLEAYGAATEAFKAGELKWEPPARATFYNWMERASTANEAAAINTFKDKPRSGRPKNEWDDLVRDQCDRLIRSGMFADVTPLWRELCEFAQARGLEEPYEVDGHHRPREH